MGYQSIIIHYGGHCPTAPFLCLPDKDVQHSWSPPKRHGKQQETERKVGDKKLSQGGTKERGKGDKKKKPVPPEIMIYQRPDLPYGKE